MERKILSSFIVINLVLCLLAGFPVQAQNSNRPPASNPPKEQKKEVDEEAFPLYNGVSVSVDLWGIGSKAFGSDFLSSEVAVDVNLKNRFFPIVELGYGSTDAWNDNGTHYKSNAPYFRIGMNYNALFKKKFKNHLFVGLRYAMSSFKYDIATLSVDDPIYGGGIGNPNQVDDIWGGSLPFNHKGMKGSMQWFEFCVGIRAHIWKELYMGWGLRFKFRTSSSTGEYGDPWYVPGFGKYGSNTISHLIESLDHWIAFAILAFLGGRMVRESFKDEDCKKEYDPKSLKVVLALAVATSIDALAIGVSFAFLGMRDFSEILPPISIIGFVSFAMSLIGLLFGIRFGCGIARKLRAELWGGIILIIIGTKILIEHLFFN